ncbi:Transcription factor bHLH35 [Heracleum sosnowskyi]|uniref:Transcription factor bHLH35 n=1 Tax=Heracleum sosnowskyi TaxID=360622 RepID=A0AAD8J9S0_9APIA|nr:Transcription factor bHLH35 [Heracleum sosnowskyi]
MECLDEYTLYWETNRYYQTQELDSLVMDSTLSTYYDSSSPDGVLQSSVAPKNIVSERNRRKKLTDRIHALRVVVPNITKLDRASTIKDAITYIQELQEQERKIQGEISQLESMASEENNSFGEFNQAAADTMIPLTVSQKKKRTHQQQLLFHNDSGSFSSLPSPVQVIELRVSYMGGKTVVVTITCWKQRDTIVKLCEAFKSLKLKVIMANITCSSETLSKTVFVQADEEEINMLRTKIESAIAALNFPDSPMSSC